MAKLSRDWQIRNLDTGEVLNPPYPVSESGVSVGGVGGTLPRQPRFGFQDPIVQWTSGQARTLSFSTVLFAEDSSVNIQAKLDAFEALAVKDERWGRPPICVFTYGKVISEMVMVESAPYTVMPIRTGGGDDDLTAREVRIDFSLVRYVPFSQVQIDPNKPSKESYYLVVRQVEASYEAIAARYYGDPLRGDRLRKRNPDMPLQPTVGEKISVPSRSIILSEEVEPSFHALSLTDESVADRYREILDERSTLKVVL